MSKVSVSMSEVRKTLMEDKEFVEEYNKLKPRYDLISQIIEERVKLCSAKDRPSSDWKLAVASQV